MTRHKLTAEAQRFLDFDPKLLAITADRVRRSMART